MKTFRQIACNLVFSFPVWFWFASICLILTKLWLARGMTFNGIGYMSADDQLFIQQAASILRGDWLGTYDYLTLFKGPFYPIFIAASSLSSLPLLTAQQILYALSCLTFCLALAPLFHRKIILALLLAALLFNPVSITNTVATRVLREGIYPALTIFSLAGAIGLILRLENKRLIRLIWTVMTGISLSAFWLTREERLWLLPALIFLVGLAVYRVWHQKAASWQVLLGSMAIPIALMGFSCVTVSAMNLKTYGLFAISEYDSSIFLKAYGSLTRVKPVTWQPLIPVSAGTRQRLYEVSPSFNQLEPYLEGNIGRLYARYGENVKNNQMEIGGGWFHIAFRHAVQAAGLMKSGKFPAGYYHQLTEEVDRSCRLRKLDCRPARTSFMAVWNDSYTKPLLKNIGKAIAYLVSFRGIDTELRECLGKTHQLEVFTNLTHERCWHFHTSVAVEGWVVKPGETISIWVHDMAGNKITSPTYHELSPDLEHYFINLGIDAPEAADARFYLEADCPKGCMLVVKGEDGSILEWINLDLPQAHVDSPDKNGLYYQIENIDWSVGDDIKWPLIYQNLARRAWLLSRIALAYQFIMPFLAAISLALYFWLCWRVFIRHQEPVCWGIASALLAAIIARLGMVAWLETSSFNAIITTYLSPAHPMLIGFAGIVFNAILSGEIQSR